jgi:zinc transport system ATP-binding protein
MKDSAKIKHMGSSAIISLKGVTAGYGNVPVLRDIDLEIERSLITGIIGENGAGKSTLFKVILGLLKPWKGSVRINSIKKELDPGSESIFGMIGYVPQRSPSGRLPLTVSDALLMGRWGVSFRGAVKPSHLDIDMVDDMLDMMGLSGHRDKDLRALSGGLRQRVALAKALISDPEILMMDEPTTYLDRSGRDAFMELVRKMHEQRGLTTLIISHDRSLIDDYAARTIEIEEGMASTSSPCPGDLNRSSPEQK